MLQILVSATILLAGSSGHADATLVGRAAIPAQNGTYGGLSAIHLSPDGTQMIALSDRGRFVEGKISRDADGKIQEITVDQPVVIEGYNPNPPDGIEDAEGIAIDPNGTIYVSFEKDHRVGQFAALDAAEQVLPRIEPFTPVSGNGGLEALAIDSKGTLYAIPERTRRRRDAFPIFRFQNGEWDVPFALPREHPYYVVGADFGPDDRLYVLERKFNGYGFYNRVRRVDLTAGTAETVLDSRFGEHGNLEGISVWENTRGETIMTLIADNNFRFFLSNEIAEYLIDG